MNSKIIWPITKLNTIFNICRNNQHHIIERFGKFSRVQAPGWYFAIPLIDKISYVVDSRETTIRVDPQHTITSDNVQVSVSGNVFVKFDNPEKAAYGSDNPFYSIDQYAQSAMRSAIGNMEFDDLLHNRNALNKTVQEALETATCDWGIAIKRYELTDITPNRHIEESLDKQAAAERMRREQILGAEGDKKSDILRSEGYRQKVINQAEADAEAVRLAAQAKVDSYRMFQEYLSTDGSDRVINLDITKDAMKMYGEIGSKSNTIFFDKEPADIKKFMAYMKNI